MLKGNIIILVHTPIPASTESEILPARSLSMIAATTARPVRNMEEDPTDTISVMIFLVQWKLRMLRWSRLCRVR